MSQLWVLVVGVVAVGCGPKGWDGTYRGALTASGVCSDGTPVSVQSPVSVTVSVSSQKVALGDGERVDGLALSDVDACADYGALLERQDKSTARLSTKACAHYEDGGLTFSPWLLGGTMRLSGDELSVSFIRTQHVADASGATVRNCNYEQAGTLAR